MHRPTAHRRASRRRQRTSFAVAATLLTMVLSVGVVSCQPEHDINAFAQQDLLGTEAAPGEMPARP